MTLAGSLLDLDEFATRTLAPASYVYGDFIDPTGAWTDSVKVAKRTAHQNFIKARLITESSKVLARLRKRYSIPLVAPYPEVILGWLADIVTPMVYRRKGIDPSDEQIASADALAATAKDELKEAADSEAGLFDLPLRQDRTDTGLDPSVGGPLSYTEASPYTWTDVQHAAALLEPKK
jgi:hypothetical protein